MSDPVPDAWCATGPPLAHTDLIEPGAIEAQPEPLQLAYEEEKCDETSQL